MNETEKNKGLTIESQELFEQKSNEFDHYCITAWGQDIQCGISLFFTCMLVWLLCRGGIISGKTSGVSPSNLICIVRNNIIKVLPTIRVMNMRAFICLKICRDKSSLEFFFGKAYCSKN